MPLYQMLCVAVHYPEYKHIKDLIHTSASHIMSAGGVVRTINAWGTRPLPQRMHRHGAFHAVGDYWTLHFDAAPRTLHALNGTMRRDPRVLRWTTLKLGDRLEALARPHDVTVERNPGAGGQFL